MSTSFFRAISEPAKRAAYPHLSREQSGLATRRQWLPAIGGNRRQLARVCAAFLARYASWRCDSRQYFELRSEVKATPQYRQTEVAVPRARLSADWRLTESVMPAILRRAIR